MFDLKLKYVKTSSGEVIIFPETIQHYEFKSFNPVSAGFCHVLNSEKKVECYGESVSLGFLKSKPIEDSKAATRAMFGVDAMFENFD
jgi:hypothetical protein